MLDLFCGRFGWGRAFAARGWEVVGVDLVEPSEVPEGCRFVRADVMQIWASPMAGAFFSVGPGLSKALAWGTGVPPVVPQGITKGFRHKEMFAHDRTNRSAVSATIPPELAGAVADYATRLCEVTA